jgi:Heparinase II/III N-terminus/Heparinase II/III-like protein
MAETAEACDLETLLRDPDTVDAAKWLLEHPPRRRPPYVPLHDPYAQEPVVEAETTLAHGWETPQVPGRVPLVPPVDWALVGGEHRSHALALYWWEPMAAPMAAFAATGVVEYLRWCLDLTLDWACQHPRLDMDSEFAWYDMAVGLRAARLAFLLPACLHSRILSEAELLLLVACARLHLRALEPDEQFAAHSNHGVYQAAGQLAASVSLPSLPEAAAARAQGGRRLEQLIEHHFDEDGAHHEHSPGYHLMVLRSMVALRTLGLVEDPRLLLRLEAAEEALSWFVAPVGTVPTVGDSDPVDRGRVAADRNLRHPAVRFAVTLGEDGVPPESSFRLFQQAGYVVARDAWSRGPAFERSSYLLQACGFHSRVHKHADDLSFVWYARGVELLADPGRFGYPKRMDPSTPLGQLGFYYDDPHRIYVESTRAHNCLEIDGSSYPRRGVPFYGSAIKSAGLDSETGVVATKAAVVHLDTIEHTRLLFHLPGEWTLVIDHASDAREQPHAFAQRFQFGPALELVDGVAGQLVLRIPTSEEYLTAVQLCAAEPLAPVRGQREPELQGFVSRTAGVLTPSWSSGWIVRDSASAVLAGLFSVSAQAEPPAACLVLSDDGSGGEVRWQTGGSTRVLRWSHAEDGVLEHVYEALPTPA